MKKIFIITVMVIGCLVIAGGSAYAHVTIEPLTGKPGITEIYTVKVENEKTIPTVSVRLIIPEGLELLSAGVKDGWIFKKIRDGENATEIEWTGGEIPAKRFDSFQLSAQNPPEPADMLWKTYQTYADGSVVAWDEIEEEGQEHSHDDGSRPAAMTKIEEEAGADSPAPVTESGHDHNMETGSDQGVDNTLSYVAIGIAALALIVAFGRKHSS